MGLLVMLLGVGSAFLGGLLRWPWPVIFAGAAVWALGYLFHKPQAMNTMRRNLVPSLGQMVVLNSIACAVLFGLGRLAASF